MRWLGSLAVLAALVPLFSCTGDGSPQFTEGAYVSDGDHTYPVVAIRYKEGSVQVYELSRVVTVAFSRGFSSTDIGTAELQTGHTVGASEEVMGLITADDDSHIRMRVLKGPIGTQDLTPANAQVLEDYALRLVTTEEALLSLRKFVRARAQGAFSAYQEEACQGAFDLPCATVFPPDAVPRSTP